MSYTLVFQNPPVIPSNRRCEFGPPKGRTLGRVKGGPNWHRSTSDEKNVAFFTFFTHPQRIPGRASYTFPCHETKLTIIDWIDSSPLKTHLQNVHAYIKKTYIYIAPLITHPSQSEHKASHFCSKRFQGHPRLWYSQPQQSCIRLSTLSQALSSFEKTIKAPQALSSIETKSMHHPKNCLYHQRTVCTIIRSVSTKLANTPTSRSWLWWWNHPWIFQDVSQSSLDNTRIIIFQCIRQSRGMQQKATRLLVTLNTRRAGPPATLLNFCQGLKPMNSIERWSRVSDGVRWKSSGR